MTNLKDIAKVLGINVSTVSRALSDSDEISESTKERVREKVREMNYVPNIAARTLTGKSTKLVGLIVPEVKSDYYAQIVNYVEAGMKQLGYTVIIGITEFNHNLEVECLNTMSSRNVDGILFVSSTDKNISKPLNHISNDYKIPIILMDPLTPKKGFDTLKLDNSGGINEALLYLINSGRKRIAYIGDVISSIGRLPSFKKGMEKAGGIIYGELIFVGEERFEQGGYLRMKEILEKDVPNPDAVFASYDDMAIGVLKALYEYGVPIPKDIAVIGYDNIRYSKYLWQALTTIHSPLEEFCKKAAELLLDRIDNPNPRKARHCSFPTRLILRETT